MKKFVISCLGVLSILPAVWAQNPGLLWEVKSPNGAVSHLYGTYHLLGADFLAERPDVISAFESSQTVVVETVIDSSKLMELAPLSFMPGKSLKAMTDSVDYALLKEKLEPVMQMDLMMLDMVKPMVLSTSYVGSLAVELTPDSLRYEGLPLDMYFARQAEKQGKKVLPLESLQEQMEILMNSEPVEEQLADLLEMLREDLAEASTIGIITAYHQDDLIALDAAAELAGMEAGDMEVLLDDRNKAWIPKLEAGLTEGGMFIAVGALHLPGANGLIALLEAKGYTLKALK